MKDKKIILTISIFLILAMGITGCRAARRPVPEENKTPPLQQAPLRETIPKQQGNDRISQGEENLINERMTPRNTETEGMNQDLTTRADNIVKEVVKIQGVRSATAVISENTAIVGVTLTNDETGQVTRETEDRIKEVVKETDRDIDRVAVTADPDLFTRVENIARESGRGRPLSGLGREIEEIFRRITPTT